MRNAIRLAVIQSAMITHHATYWILARARLRFNEIRRPGLGRLRLPVLIIVEPRPQAYYNYYAQRFSF